MCKGSEGGRLRVRDVPLAPRARGVTGGRHCPRRPPAHRRSASAAHMAIWRPPGRGNVCRIGRKRRAAGSKLPAGGGYVAAGGVADLRNAASLLDSMMLWSVSRREDGRGEWEQRIGLLGPECKPHLPLVLPRRVGFSTANRSRGWRFPARSSSEGSHRSRASAVDRCGLRSLRIRLTADRVPLAWAPARSGPEMPSRKGP